ncbi:hypothetical protein [Falsirhodobacter xinxiangensis]|uniref:hypothetical protein n=1 Tax=Falsirhodobacter xinxiangensis TaxID=2530049 RepID=UPI0010AA669B|nr:hypothetical protein [Rhodobacter xinxiangensis]
MQFHLSYRINRLEGVITGDLPTVLRDFADMVAHRLAIETDWREYRPPSVPELRQMIAASGRDIEFDLDYG